MNKYKRIIKSLLKAANQNYEESIIEFFKSKNPPADKDIHAFAEDLGIDAHKFEEEIYKLLHSLVNSEPSAGKHRDSPDSDFDADELAMGIDIEKEHTDDEALAKEISKDHLVEIPDYYTRLKAMEEAGKKAKGKDVEGCPGCDANLTNDQKILSAFLKEAENIDIPRFVDTKARSAARQWFIDAVKYDPTERFYVYYKPSNGKYEGEVKLFPSIEKPGNNWVLAWKEGIRSSKSEEQVFYILRKIIKKLPILPQTN